MEKNNIIPIRGFLLHITHYDPRWWEQKSSEKPFDLNVGLEIIDAMAQAGLNLLIIDCADGIKYKSHPELTRHYSVPMEYLKKIMKHARKYNIEIVPKLNFSQSRFHRHNHWFRPHNGLFDNNEYWEKAFEIIDELIQVCKPCKYFHIGMDEDHDRAHSQYINAIKKLHNGLKQRGMRTIIWNDTALTGSMLVHAEKSLAAEDKIPDDIIHVVWDYAQAQPKIVNRLVKKGFEVWGAPGRSAERVSEWRKSIIRCGGKGLLLTAWIPTYKETRSKLLQVIKELGPICKKMGTVLISENK